MSANIAFLPSAVRFHDSTYAPLYCATSSPRMKTLSLLSSSSANASFRASLTVYSFDPAGVAYVRIRGEEEEAAGRKEDLRGTTPRCDNRREAGLRSREAAIGIQKALQEWQGKRGPQLTLSDFRAEAVGLRAVTLRKVN